MSDIAVKVEDLSKLYRLGEIGTGTISHDVNRWWSKVRGKEDPYTIVGEVNDRTSKGKSDFVWSLKDVSFEVKQGEVLGIIGRNGAGKSTLLKILSKVTTPTKGRIKVKGRIASLLEVGTGFHPELTGRENIFLNGAILGMTKSEIKSKFDEIVDFAGVERYIDTPVKRYSSGMYVRLAFAVAAFLEPEILIVDEVLAVGDAEFQKKCLGRMKDVSKNDGRTVLFVSHDLNAVEQLCQRVLLFEKGTMRSEGDAASIVNLYINGARKVQEELFVKLSNNVSLIEYTLNPNIIVSGGGLSFSLKLKFNAGVPILNDLSLLIYNSKNIRVAILDLRPNFSKVEIVGNCLTYSGMIENLDLVEGIYYFGLFYNVDNQYGDIYDLTSLTVKPVLSNTSLKKYDPMHRGVIELKHI